MAMPMNYRVYYLERPSSMVTFLDFFATREEVAREGASQLVRRKKGTLRRVVVLNENGQELGVVLSA